MERVDDKLFSQPDHRLEKLRELFPELFSDSRLDLNKLRLYLGDQLVEGNDQYDFTWFGKHAAHRSAFDPVNSILALNRAKSINWNTTGNMYFEGDNLEVLRHLIVSHREKIKMIYIDPPYNTGMDFIYKDNFSAASSYHSTDQDENTHTNWLNFIYPRLVLARELLTEDGMIFISISEKELYNLKKVGDGIFGEENFVCTFIWEKKKKPSFLDRNVGCVTEYIVVFSKNKSATHALSIEKTEKGKRYPLNNAGNSLRTLTFPKGTVRFGLTDGLVQAQDMSNGKIITELLDDVVIRNGRNENSFRLKGEWRYSQAKLDEIILQGEEIVISKIPFRPNHVKKGGDVKKIKNLFTINGYGFPTYEDADKEITNIFGKKVFDYSKPEKLIRRLIQAFLYQDEQAIVLDFFSGSATTGEAVWRLNQELGTNHQFILIQLPERIKKNSVAYREGFRTISEIGRERLLRCREEILVNSPKSDLGFQFIELMEK